MTIKIVKDNAPQTLLTLGKDSFARYHVTGNDKTNNEIIIKPLNKISIAQANYIL